MSITEKKVQVDKNGCKYILFRINVYLTEYLLVVEMIKNIILTGKLCFK